MFGFVFFSLLLFGSCLCLDCPCNYVDVLDVNDPMFISCMCYFEGRMQETSFWMDAALTKDGHFFQYGSGEISGAPIHNFSAASKESLHLGVLSKAIEGNKNAGLFVCSYQCHQQQLSFDECAALAFVNGSKIAMELLDRKMDSLWAFAKNSPGYGGFLPWFTVDNGLVAPLTSWELRVPALDNGEMIFGLLGCIQALRHIETAFSEKLLAKVEAYVNLLQQTALNVFYDGNGYFRAVTSIKDAKTAPVASNYYCPSSGCGYLDDPYEGELFVFWAYLYGNWSGWKGKDMVFVNKRKNLVELTFQNSSIQRGFWFRFEFLSVAHALF